MKAVTFLLHTQQPILATSLQGDPNSDVSHSYIPGSMIRGMLIGRYLKSQGLKHADDILDSQRFPKVKRLFFDEQETRYLNAYPTAPEKKRTLPVPRSWYKNKGEEFYEKEDKDIYIYDFSKILVDERDEYLPDNFSAKLLNEEFCTVEDNEVILYRVKRRINIHNQRDRKRGKGIEGSGAVFRYDAIDAGQTFQAVVLCNSDQDKAIIESLLQPEDILLGGSKRAGYGHARIELLPNDSDWDEVGNDCQERLERDENLTITLLSDTIIRNEYGQTVSDPEALRKLISELLNLEEELKFKEGGIYASSLIVGGFNGKWGLPLPQTPAFAAGSVFVFEKVDLDLKRVKTLEGQGIGERRVDGFGRLVVNWLDEQTEYQAKLPQPKARHHQTANTGESLESKSVKIAGDIASRIVRKKLDELLLNKVGTIQITNKEKIFNSQLSRLMIVARQSLSELEIEQTKPESERKSIAELAAPIRDLLHNLPSNARNQFERIRINNEERLDEQIHTWLISPEDWLKNSWRSAPQTRDLVVASQPTVTIAGVQRNFDAYTALEYSLRLIMAVAKKTIKEKSHD